MKQFFLLLLFSVSLYPLHIQNTQSLPDPIEVKVQLAEHLARRSVINLAIK